MIDVTLYQISRNSMALSLLANPRVFVLITSVTIECYHPNASLLQVDDNEMARKPFILI